jgi:precorrin-2 dehydrogenase/sirohydrochlorin ferrochelatase
MKELLFAAIDLHDKSCVIIGGGAVAGRKAKKLINCGAAVRIVAPAVTKAIEDMAQKGVISLKKRRYRKGDIKGAFLAVIATNDDTVNKKALNEAAQQKILINAAFNKDYGNVFFTATKDTGDFVLSVMTKELSPKKSNKILDEISKNI